ncbi:Putative cytidine and deoxycytidylate deaminase domain, APOBEC/CMP deaminase, zinc-binding protein [Septoria linicola]|uniref:Deoxycytidylate deaminase n=1 Tax=Septoria linicola TaxID=215465 RepID=A0A9Q9EMC5_9PEZI|nr:Putative cytidine and deoxycytidylate deaminase domain, APOBEC/CMP deaminase, zinc-binding protein [Septoria linicola]
MLIGLCGGICSGKHSVLDYLVQRHNFQVLTVPRSTSTPSVAKSASEAHVLANSTHPGTTFFKIEDLLDYATKYWQENFVTPSIHNLDDLSVLNRRPFFILVHIDAPISLRWTRFKAICASSSLTPPTLEQFVLRNDTHLYSPDTNLSTVASLAQIKLLNSTTSLPKLWASLDALNLTDPSRIRPAWDHYFMTLASLAARRSNCMRRQVGCVLVRNKRILATGYNGTPRNIKNCADGGCPRCNSTSTTTSSTSGGADLSTCLCIHAEENALLEAGRERINTSSVLYCNTCPCLTCTIKIVQVGITEVVYSQSYYMDAEAAKIFLEAGVKLRQFSPPREGLVDLERQWEELVGSGRAPRKTGRLGGVESWTHGVFSVESEDENAEKVNGDVNGFHE